MNPSMNPTVHRLCLRAAGLVCAGSVWAGLCLPLTAAAAAAQPADAAQAAQAAIALVLPQSEVAFTIKQMGVPVSGRFKRFGVQTNFNPKSPQTSQVTVRFELASATVSADADAELGKPEWFASARFPQATFQSTGIKALGAGRFEVAGKLFIKGIGRDVRVPIQLSQSGALSTITGALALQRLDFKVGEGDWADTSFVANEVQVRFKFVLQGVPAQ